MKIPFVGPSYTARSPNADGQRSINCYLEMDQGNPRAPVALYGRPGKVLRATLASGATRGCIASGLFWYFVAGSHVYRIDSAYTVTDCGAIGTSTGRVGMATNGTEVLIVDGTAGWLVTGTTLAVIGDVDFPNGVTYATYQDGFFIVSGDGTQAFYWNETPNDGTAWNGLDVASAEGLPDNLLGSFSDHRELWQFGSLSTELFVNTGDSAGLFQRSGNTFIEQGCASIWTVAAMDNTIFWLGSGRHGQGIVFRAQGYTPTRISTHALETAIRGYSTISDAFAYCYQIDGHAFYLLTFPTANATWAYDAATNAWFEWLWRDPSTNVLHRDRVACCAFNNGVHLAGDWETGKVYSIEMDTYTDNGDPIPLIRRTQTANEDNARLFFEMVELDMETGVANADCTDPQVMLRYSNDGHTWSNERQRSIGAVGEYGKRVKFGPSGSGRNRLWELSITDPVKRAIFGAWARVTKGDA
jgi:hypothetical protein